MRRGSLIFTGQSVSSTFMYPIPADSLANSIGVNVHVEDAHYNSNWNSTLIPAMISAGIRFIRNGIINNPNTPGDRARLVLRNSMMSQAGCRLSAVCNNSYDESFLDADYASNGNFIAFYEGANEPNVVGGWVPPTQAAMSQLWNAVQASSVVGPTGANVPVCGPSLTGGANWNQLGNQSAVVNFGNMHPYNNGFNPEIPYTHGGSIGKYLGEIAVPFPNRPIVATEIGYTSALGDPTVAGAPEDIIARYYPRMFLWNLMQGIPYTYIHQLLANHPFDNTSFVTGYGLIRYDLSSTPGWLAVQALFALFRDSPFSPAPATYSVVGGDASVQNVLFQKRDGTYMLAIWIGASGWDPHTQVYTPVASQNIVLGLPTSSAIVTTFNDDGTQTVTTFTSNPFVATDKLAVLSWR